MENLRRVEQARGERLGSYRIAAVCAAAMAGLVVAAPPASAHTISDLTVAPGLGNGYGTGCSYLISASVDTDADDLIFLDDDWEIRASRQYSGTTTSIVWTPVHPGTHVIRAQMIVGSYESTTITVVVGTGINLGSACVVR